jgi:hypothetical protein
MSIEQSLERIAVALEAQLSYLRGEGAPKQVTETPKKTKRVKETGMPAQQAAAVVEDAIPGMEVVDAGPVAAVAVPGISTGAELRAAAQGYIAAADKVGPDMVGKLVTFIQSVAKIFNAAEPKLIKIPDAKVPEAAAMIANWCANNGIKV